MFLRFLKTVINVERTNESLREVLFSHKAFNCESAFQHFDKDQTGTISSKKFDEAFKKADLSTAAGESDRFVLCMDDDDDNTVD